MTENEDQPGDLNATLAWLLSVLTRRRWSILLPACGITLLSIAAVLMLPDHYTSEATLLIVQQQVPQRYVVPNSTTDLTSALAAMKQEVLSRNRLLKMIDDFGLYAKERRRLAPEQLVGLMLKDIEITPVGERTQQKDYDAFKISFTTESAVLAQQVTSTLTALFINENLRMKEEQATNTTNFLHEQLQAKRKQMEEQEQRLREFKLQHIGELPEQQAGNLGILTGLQTQMQNTTTNLNHARQQQAYLQSLLDTYRRQPLARGAAVMPGTAAANPAVTPLQAAQDELARLQAARSALLAKYTPEHPDVVKAERDVSKAQEMVRRLEASNAHPVRNAAPAVQTIAQPPDAAEETAMAQLRSQLEANRVEIDHLSKDEKQLKGVIAQYESRINQTPVREQQQSGIVRETEALRQEYAELQKKEQESQLATNLEKQQGGQQFRLVDPASVPAIPSSPKRMKLSAMGAGCGLFLGFALAFVMEKRDRSIHAEQDLTRRFNPAPFILGIPVIPTPAEVRRGNWVSRLEWIAASTLVLAVSIAELYVYKHG